MLTMVFKGLYFENSLGKQSNNLVKKQLYDQVLIQFKFQINFKLQPLFKFKSQVPIKLYNLDRRCYKQQNLNIPQHMSTLPQSQNTIPQEIFVKSCFTSKDQKGNLKDTYYSTNNLMICRENAGQKKKQKSNNEKNQINKQQKKDQNRTPDKVKSQNKNQSKTNQKINKKDKEDKGSKQKNTLYMPAYLTAHLKNMTELDIQSLNGRANIKLFFKIFYGDLFEAKHITTQQKDQIIKVFTNDIALNFVRDQPIYLRQNDENEEIKISINHFEQQKMIQYSIHKIYYLTLDADVFWSPFQIINGILQVTVQPVKIKTSRFYKKSKQQQKHKLQQFNVEFNLMDHQYQNLKITFTNWSTFGNYDLAQQLLASFYANYRVYSAKWFKFGPEGRYQLRNQKNSNDESQNLVKKFKNLKNIIPFFRQQDKNLKIQKKSKKPQAFHYAYFNIPLYKYPFSALATIFFPLWLLSIINLGIFYDQSKLSDRIVCISAIMLAFVQLIPTIRGQIPPGSKFLFVQLLVYLQSLTTLLALIDSLNVKDLTGYDLNWIQSGFFISSIIINILTFLIVLILFIIHKLYWQPGYNLNYEGQKMKFIRNHWFNLESDLYFDQKFNIERQDSYLVLDKKQEKQKKQKESKHIQNINQNTATPNKKQPSLEKSINNEQLTQQTLIHNRSDVDMKTGAKGKHKKNQSRRDFLNNLSQKWQLDNNKENQEEKKPLMPKQTQKKIEEQRFN